jgi:hypothetical protein
MFSRFRSPDRSSRRFTASICLYRLSSFRFIGLVPFAIVFCPNTLRGHFIGTPLDDGHPLEFQFFSVCEKQFESTAPPPAAVHAAHELDKGRHLAKCRGFRAGCARASRPALAGNATATTRADETRNDVIPGLTCGHSGEQEDTRRGMLESRQWWGVSPKNVRRNGYAQGDQVLPGVPAGGGGCPSQSQSRPEDTEEQFTVWVSPAITSQKRGANFRC